MPKARVARRRRLEGAPSSPLQAFSLEEGITVACWHGVLLLVHDCSSPVVLLAWANRGQNCSSKSPAPTWSFFKEFFKRSRLSNAHSLFFFHRILLGFLVSLD
jgi:hypothetical protein